MKNKEQNIRLAETTIFKYNQFLKGDYKLSNLFNTPKGCSFCINYYDFNNIAQTNCSDCPISINRKMMCIEFEWYKIMVLYFEELNENVEYETITKKDFDICVNKGISALKRLIKNDGKLSKFDIKLLEYENN